MRWASEAIVLERPALFDVDEVLTLAAATQDACSELGTDADWGAGRM